MSWPKSPLVEIVWFAAGMSLLLPAAMPALRLFPSLVLPFAMIVCYSVPGTICLWVAADMRSRGRTPPFELPFFILLAWPLSLMWYCIWTRGWSGMALAFGLIVLPYVSLFFAGIILSIWLLVAS